MKEKRREGSTSRERGRGEVKKRARKAAELSRKMVQKKQTGRTSAEKKKKRARNKEFARVTYIFVALFIAMMGYISLF